MISTGRPHHITALRLPGPLPGFTNYQGSPALESHASLILAHTQGVFRGAHQATSKFGSPRFPASSWRTIWLLRTVVFNMHLGCLDKAPRFLLVGLGEDVRGDSAVLGPEMLMWLRLHQSYESYQSLGCRFFLMHRNQSWLQQWSRLCALWQRGKCPLFGGEN